MLDQLATKLLYVEDDDDFREIISRTFVDAGFDVTAVASAESALEELGSARYDIVVTDYNLTGETGAWLLSEASSRGYLRRTAAVVLTSERRPRGVEGYRVLQKPVAVGSLLDTIADAIGELPPEPVVRLGAQPPAARPLELDFVLYVTRSSQESHTAVRNLRRALESYDETRFRLTIFDVAKGGDAAWFASLEEDRIIVTPTLVRKTPGPTTWTVGSLSPAAVEQMVASVLGAGREAR
jgi:CheY-like chemotaxis protein